MKTLGQALELEFAKARRRITLIAPFMKSAVVGRLLSRVEKDISIECVTRWRPEEVASGVSDLEVQDLVSAYPNSSLTICDALHGKLYAADDRCWVGSANLTAAAVGWKSRPNVELMLPSNLDEPHIGEFLRDVRSQAVFPTPAMRAIIEETAAVMRERYSRPGRAWAPSTRGSPPAERSDAWLPRFRSPRQLLEYAQGRFDGITAEGQEDAEADLEALEIPYRAHEDILRGIVCTRLLQLPVVARVREALGDGAMTAHELLQDAHMHISGTGPYASEVEALEILTMWLQEFCSAVFRIEIDAADPERWRIALVRP